jgi:hypothetical protein
LSSRFVVVVNLTIAHPATPRFIDFEFSKLIDGLAGIQAGGVLLLVTDPIVPVRQMVARDAKETRRFSIRERSKRSCQEHQHCIQGSEFFVVKPRLMSE